MSVCTFFRLFLFFLFSFSSPLCLFFSLFCRCHAAARAIICDFWNSECRRRDLLHSRRAPVTSAVTEAALLYSI
jgi:hypothetical protein